MARVLVIDPIASHASKVRSILEARNRRVTVILPQQFPETPELILRRFVVIVNLTLNRCEEWDVLHRVCHGRPTEHDRPGVLALSSVYRGPGFRLAAERMGCRFLYDG